MAIVQYWLYGIGIEPLVLKLGYGNLEIVKIQRD